MVARAHKASSSPRARTPLWNVVRSIEKDSDTFRGKVASVISTAEAAAAENLQRAPYTTLGAAAAVGYVLGGGITPRILLAAFWLGGRTAVSALAQELLVEKLFPKQPARDREDTSPRRDS
jgi:ElaB/YqjD/DUF883 family membrane-anchored ribosome-binding protein